jgi:hypothetical protein
MVDGMSATITEKHVWLAAKLYAVREEVRTMLGENFAVAMREGGTMLANAALRRGRSPLEIAMKLARSCQADGKAFDGAVIIAAAVELLEPSARAGGNAP